MAHEVKAWSRLARQIPDAPLRRDALSALAEKRGQVDGAALFSVLTRSRNLELLRLLTAYQVIWDYLDSVHERAPTRENGDALHVALIDALDPKRPIHDYYNHHPWTDDGGYLRTLVTVCRKCCLGLSGYERVREIVIGEATRAQVLTLNHDLAPARRDRDLRAWVAKEFPTRQDASWYELTGAASAGLTIFALLALAAEPTCSKADIVRTYDTYFPWASALATMLDSYVDQAQDISKGDHIYISHYPSTEVALEKTCRLVRRSLLAAQRSRNGEKHVVIVASMVAMYLSKDSAREVVRRSATSRIAEAGGSLTRMLLPILRLWRIAYTLRSA